MKQSLFYFIIDTNHQYADRDGSESVIINVVFEVHKPKKFKRYKVYAFNHRN